MIRTGIEKATRARIDKIHNKFHHAAQLKPHCTLLNFAQYQNMENYLIKRFDSLARSFSPVKITLDGFGQYPFHNIYVKVEDDKKLSKTVKIMRLKLKPVLKDSKHLKQPICQIHI